jgi:hypothetical protein
LLQTYEEAYDFLFVTIEDSVLKLISFDYSVRTILKDIKIEHEPKWLNLEFKAEKLFNYS